MDDSTLSHLGARARGRAARAVEAALIAISRSVREGRDVSERNIDHRRCSGSETHHVRLFLRTERMTLKHRSTIDGVDRRTTVTASAAASLPALPRTVGEAFRPLERWLSEILRDEDHALADAHRASSRTATQALIAAACRRDDGWSCATATMGWSGSGPHATLIYPNERGMLRFGDPSDPFRHGTISCGLLAALRPDPTLLHITSAVLVSAPGTAITFGAPPPIRIRDTEVSAMSRLHGIAAAMSMGWELTGGTANR